MDGFVKCSRSRRSNSSDRIFCENILPDEPVCQPLDGFMDELAHRGVQGSLHMLCMLRTDVTALTAQAVVTRRASAPMLLFSNAPLGPDHDPLFAVVRHNSSTMAILCEMDNAEIDLRLAPSRAGSHTGIFGEPSRTRNSLGLGVLCSSLRVYKTGKWQL